MKVGQEGEGPRRRPWREPCALTCAADSGPSCAPCTARRGRLPLCKHGCKRGSALGAPTRQAGRGGRDAPPRQQRQPVRAPPKASVGPGAAAPASPLPFAARVPGLAGGAVSRRTAYSSADACRDVSGAWTPALEGPGCCRPGGTRGGPAGSALWLRPQGPRLGQRPHGHVDLCRVPACRGPCRGLGAPLQGCPVAAGRRRCRTSSPW